MTGKFHPKAQSTRYPGGVRIDLAGDGAMAVYHAGRPYPAGTVGAHITARRPGR